MIMEKSGEANRDPSSISWRQRFLHGVSFKRCCSRQVSSITAQKFRDQTSFKRWNTHERKSTDDIPYTNVVQEDASRTNKDSQRPLTTYSEPFQPTSYGSSGVEHGSRQILSSHISVDSNLFGPYGSVSSVSSRLVDIPPRAKLKAVPTSRWAFTNAARLEQETESDAMPGLKPAPPLESKPITRSWFSATSSEITRSVALYDIASERPSTRISVTASFSARRVSNTPSYSSEIDTMFAMIRTTEPDQLNRSADVPDTSVFGQPIIQKPRLILNAV
jgi:hypothetical protein